MENIKRDEFHPHVKNIVKSTE